MKYYFLDTEFNEDGDVIDLISIGVVSEDNHEFYRISTDFEPYNCNNFVQVNVLPNLGSGVWANNGKIRRDLCDFLGINIHQVTGEKIQFVGYYADYDHVVLAQLFGRMVDMPRDISYFTLDIKQEAFFKDVDLKKAVGENDSHNALEDAKWNKKAWDYLRLNFGKEYK